MKYSVIKTYTYLDGRTAAAAITKNMSYEIAASIARTLNYHNTDILTNNRTTLYTVKSKRTE